MEFANTLPDMATQVALIIGVALIAVDVLIFGFATLVLTLLGLGFLVTGGAIHFEFATTYSGAIGWLSVSTALLSAALWKPLQSITNGAVKNETVSDFHGLVFVLDKDIDEDSPGTHSYSGIDWAVHTKEPIPAGTKVVVTEVGVGRFDVKPQS